MLATLNVIWLSNSNKIPSSFGPMLSRGYCTVSELRKKQINTLKVFNDNVNEVSEDTEYHIFFQSGANNLCLVVLLPEDFPNEKPLLRVSPTVAHHWVDSDGNVTGAPGLLNFTVHSDLGRVVQAVIREFEKTAPPLSSEQITSAINSPMGTTVVLDGENVGCQNPGFSLNYTSRRSFSPPIIVPMLDKAFPELNLMSLEELQFLNTNEDQQQEFLESQAVIGATRRSLDEMMSLVEELAESNLSKEKDVSILQHDIETKIEEVTKLAFENERLNMSYQTLSEKYSPRNIKDQLKSAAKIADAETEKIANAFLNGEIDVEKFLQTYLNSRKLTQMRKTKEEKLSQQLQSLKQAGF